MATAKKTPVKRKAPTKTSTANKNAAKAAPKSAAPSASDAIDEQLARYRSMRHFDVTAEPDGSEQPISATKLPFVIQKHAASHLHYDFRLGWNGVLKSWAIAKGPSYVVADKRLAVQVEDHPMEYGGFEGIIPKGQYGGGTVMVWDQGWWEPQPAYPDVDAGLRDGSLKIIMHGTKMQGKWALIRIKSRPGSKYGNSSKPNWLLIKEHDDFERSDKAPAITEAEPNSVVTGRDLDQIAANEDHVWNSKDTANPNASAWFRQDEKPGNEKPKQKSPGAHKSSGAPSLAASPPRVGSTTLRTSPSKFTSDLKAAPKETLPDFISPQLATQATAPPAEPGWLHELKLDGYRIQARKNGVKVELLTRTGLDWTHRMKSLAAAIATLPAQSAVLDGEVVVIAENGTTSFADLQAAFEEKTRTAKKPLTYFAFDLLHLNGHNLRNLPLIDRKKILADLLTDPPQSIHLCEHLEGDGAPIFRSACELHAEGIISKRAFAKYTSGRGNSWLKLKCIREQEFVIGGFTLPAKGHAGIHGIGALLLGYYDGPPGGPPGNLIYAGRTGTGFTQKTHTTIRTQLEKLRTTTNPFHKPPAEARNGIIPVKPILVAQVNFATWTADNLVRQASFKGIREDKPATEIRREDAANSSEPRTESAVTAQTDRVPHPLQQLAKGGMKTFFPSSVNNSAHAPIRLTHPDKILDPDSHLTKQQLADYYWAIAPHMLPQIAGRPLSLVRCPEGSSHQCFFQKHVNATLPNDIESVPVPDKKTGKIEQYITLSKPETLAALAQLGVLEIHPWGSRNDDLEHPDRIIIDLDPDTAISWATLADTAADLRQHLKKLGLESFLKSTGGKGLHVVVPIEPHYDWTTIKQFAHAFVLQIEKSNPRLYLTKMSKAARTGKIYLDYLRNERGATAVAAFSPRARTGANVSLPLNWTDLNLEARPTFSVADYETWNPRLKKDPWKQLPETKQSLTKENLASYKIQPDN